MITDSGRVYLRCGRCQCSKSGKLFFSRNGPIPLSSSQTPQTPPHMRNNYITDRNRIGTNSPKNLQLTPMGNLIANRSEGKKLGQGLRFADFDERRLLKVSVTTYELFSDTAASHKLFGDFQYKSVQVSRESTFQNSTPVNHDSNQYSVRHYDLG